MQIAQRTIQEVGWNFPIRNNFDQRKNTLKGFESQINQ